MMRYRKNTLFLFFGFLLFISIGCEDDPLLAPQSEAEDDGGSYGNLSLPGDENDEGQENPELF